jgi:hypothetical protein
MQPAFCILGKAKNMDFSYLSHGTSFVLVFPNLRLTDKKARGSALEPWAALRAAPTSRNLVHILNHVRTYFINNPENVAARKKG